MIKNNPAVWAGFEAPDGHELAWRVVHPDGRSRGDFQWPFKGVVKVRKSGILLHDGACPSRVGDGVCLAKSWYGAASCGIRASTGLAVAYRSEDVLGQDESKLRVSRCLVLGVIDLQRLLGEGRGKGANLFGADLTRADLSGANLSGANLFGANLFGADLTRADLSGANLTRADLFGADLTRADLSGADLTRANLTRANLYGADLYGVVGYKP